MNISILIINRVLKKLQWLHTTLVNLQSLVEISFIKEKTRQDVQYLVTNQTKPESADEEIFFLVKNILYAGEFENNLPIGTFPKASVISKIFIDRKIFYYLKNIQYFIRKKIFFAFELSKIIQLYYFWRFHSKCIVRHRIPPSPLLLTLGKVRLY